MKFNITKYCYLFLVTLFILLSLMRLLKTTEVEVEEEENLVSKEDKYIATRTHNYLSSSSSLIFKFESISSTIINKFTSVTNLSLFDQCSKQWRHIDFFFFFFKIFILCDICWFLLGANSIYLSNSLSRSLIKTIALWNKKKKK